MIRYRLRRKGNYFSLLVRGKYKLEYRPGSVITAPKGTLGIFCFKTKKDAENFRRGYMSQSEKTWEVYEVEIEKKSRDRRPMRICGFLDERRLDLFYGEKGLQYSEYPFFPEIICYNKVKVLN